MILKQARYLRKKEFESPLRPIIALNRRFRLEISLAICRVFGMEQ